MFGRTRQIARRIPPLAVAAVAALVASCGGGDKTTGPGPLAATIEITSTADSLIEGQTLSLTATVRDEHGTAIERPVFWTSADTTIATIEGTTLTAKAPGTVVIVAVSDSKSAVTQLRIVGEIAGIAIAPKPLALIVGGVATLAATVTDRGGHLLTGRTVTWSSANTAIVTVNSSGLVTANAVGSAYVIATAGTKKDSALVSVTAAPAPVASVTIAPKPVTVTVGATATLTATTRDASGNALIGRAVTWSSSDNTKATVNSSGVVAGVAVGTARIYALSEGVRDSADVTVQAPVASVAVSPKPVSIVIGQSVAMTATTKDASGAIVTGRAIAWSVADPSRASVTSAGVLTGVAAGSTYVIAVSEGKRDSAAVTVTVPSVATVTVTPNPASVTTGGTVQMTATLKDAGGATLTGRPVTWETGDSSKATVSSTGLVTGVTAGTTRVYATSEGKKDSATVNVLLSAGTTPAFISILGPSIRAAMQGTALTDSLQVAVVDSASRPVPGVTVAWQSSFENFGTSVTNSTGVAGLVGARVPDDPSVNTFSVTATIPNGKSATFSFRRLDPLLLKVRSDSGDWQIGQPNQMLPKPLVVRVFERRSGSSDLYWPGVAVEWVVTSGGGRVSSHFSYTDANGFARTNWIMGPSAGDATVEARVVGMPTVQFGATVPSGPSTVASLQRIAGDSQTTTTRRIRLPIDLKVRALDATGGPLSGVTIYWHVEKGGGSVSATSSTTDASGYATTSWTVGASGDQSVIVQAASGASTTFKAFIPHSIAGVKLQVSPASYSQSFLLAPGMGREFMIVPTDSAGKPASLSGSTVVWSSSNTSQLSLSAPGAPPAAYADTTFYRFIRANALSVGTPTLAVTVEGISGRLSGKTTPGAAITIKAPVKLKDFSRATGVGDGGWTCAMTLADEIYCNHVKVAVPGTPVRVEAGNNFACDLTTAGAVWCWGSSLSGFPSTPTLIAGTYAAISARGEGACALTSDGAAYCWTGTSLTPTPASSRMFSSISTSAHSYLLCGVATSGGAFCLPNASAEVAVSTIASQVSPGVGSISSSPSWCVLEGDVGRCGGSIGTGSVTPGAGLTAILTGGSSSGNPGYGTSFDFPRACGLTASGSMYCWGYGRWVLSGSKPDAPIIGTLAAPVRIPEIPAISRIIADWCGMTASGEVYCEGDPITDP